MGDEADDILRSFGLTEDDQKDYKVIIERFDSHFIKRRNAIYERTKFNSRSQEQGEPVVAMGYCMTKLLKFGI